MVKTILKNISLDKLKEFNEHPFESYSDEKLEELAVSIKEYGLQNPIIVRPIEGSDLYEIIAGHNRVRAVRHNGGKSISAIVKNMSDDEAKIIMDETNLRQREKMKPSEKILAYSIEARVLKSQGKLAGTTKRKELQKMFGESGKQIERYLHLAELIPPLIQRLDKGEIPQNVGVLLSSFDKDEQALIEQYFFTERKRKLDIKTLKRLKEFAGRLCKSDVIAQAAENDQYDKGQEVISFKRGLIRSYVPDDLTVSEIVRRIKWLFSQDNPRFYTENGLPVYRQMDTDEEVKK